MDKVELCASFLEMDKVEIRDHEHDTKNGDGVKAGILIHEAPHPGWLIGCIAPRELNNKTDSHDKGPSRRAMETIFRLMGGFSTGKKPSYWLWIGKNTVAKGK